MDVTDIEALKQLLGQLAVITQQLDRRSTLAVQHVESSTAALDQGLRALGTGSERFVKETTRAIGDQARRAIAEGAGNAMLAFEQQLRASARAAQLAAQAMETQRHGLTAARRTLVWNGLLALLIGSLLATGTAGYVGWQTVQKVKSAQFGQDILRATEAGVLTRCGKALCVKTDNPAQRYGRDAAYVLLPN